MRVAVVGGGLFGATAALFAARAGHDVHLYETKPDLMLGATAGTYSRLHRGAHYPRSPETGWESRRAEVAFRDEYGAAVIDGGRQMYVVPQSRVNHVTADEFRDFLDRNDLFFSEEPDGVFTVTEPRVHLAGLQVLVREKVHASGVTVHLGQALPRDARDRFDRIVVATYSNLNAVLEQLGGVQDLYKFQVVERPVVLLPDQFRETSIVVIDGPFGCIDPLDTTPLHVLGHVVHTVRAENVGFQPNIPERWKPLIDKGIIRDFEDTRFRRIVDDLAQYIHGLREARYIGSSFVVRSVLANVERTDARPTLVNRADPQVISVFSGKLGTAVRAATDVLGLIEQKEVLAA